MAGGRVPGRLDGGRGVVATSSGPAGLTHSHNTGAVLHSSAPRRGVRPGPNPQSAPRLVGLTVTHGAVRDPIKARTWNSYLFDGDNVIVLAKTEPDRFSSWNQIEWISTGGKRIVGMGNGWSLPRSALKQFKVKATLGGKSEEIVVSVGTLVELGGSGESGGRRGTPLNPVERGEKINLYGGHETDHLGFRDYAVLRVYNTELGFVRPLTKAALNTPPPDGPGLSDGCAGDIFIRATPFFLPTYFAIERLRNKALCRITYFTPAQSMADKFLAAFPDAAHVQHCRVDGTFANVIEYPGSPQWSRVSLDPRVLPGADFNSNDGKFRRLEGEE